MEKKFFIVVDVVESNCGIRGDYFAEIESARDYAKKLSRSSPDESFFVMEAVVGFRIPVLSPEEITLK